VIEKMELNLFDAPPPPTSFKSKTQRKKEKREHNRQVFKLQKKGLSVPTSEPPQTQAPQQQHNQHQNESPSQATDQFSIPTVPPIQYSGKEFKPAASQNDYNSSTVGKKRPYQSGDNINTYPAKKQKTDHNDEVPATENSTLTTQAETPKRKPYVKGKGWKQFDAEIKSDQSDRKDDESVFAANSFEALGIAPRVIQTLEGTKRCFLCICCCIHQPP
jgi:hypothetical protein